MRPTEQAFVHSSFAHEQGLESNQRLEFIGDAVLGCIIAKYLYEKYPNKSEGFLTNAKTNLVNNEALAKAALVAKLNRRILLGKSVEKSGDRNHSSLLADCFEAYVGALFIEYGLSAATTFVMQHIDKSVIEQLPDSKSRIQEYAQSIKKTVVYSVINTTGSEHEKTFKVQLVIEGLCSTTGYGKSIKAAQKEAALNALKGLGL